MINNVNSILVANFDIFSFLIIGTSDKIIKIRPYIPKNKGNGYKPPTKEK